MIKIIDGFRYDTTKATEIGSADSGGSRSDFRYWSETLYKSPRAGRFFIAGEGHAMTRWGRRTADGMRGWGEGVLPLTPEDARTWCEQHLEGSDWAAHFPPDMIQDA
jgi:hypothetical protein